MLLYLNAVMKDKSEEARYSKILFVIGERGGEIFNTWTWGKVQDDNGNDTDVDNITVEALLQNFEEYYMPKRNLVVERRRFFQRSQDSEETVNAY